jgi:Domain of unknown function (DUF3854)
LEEYNPELESTNLSLVSPNGQQKATVPTARTSNDHDRVVSQDLEGRLSPDHLRMLLEESGLSRGVVEARGYRTVETKADLKRRGFADSQCNPPGLLVPIYSPTGEIVNYQFRPDLPRIKDGRPVKYETPRGSRMALDVHPFAREKLCDPSVPLFITEGVKKGDALVSRGLCAVALLGVWNWRGANEKGGLTALPEWELIALNDRQVYLVFDSDVMLKPQVHTALARFKGFLEVR